LPYGLNAKGIGQARDAAYRIAELVQEHGWQLHPVIDTSRMRRAAETATVMAEELAARVGVDLNVQEFDALAERGLGALANLDVATIERLVREDARFEPLPEGWKSSSAFRLPVQGAESLLDAGQRVFEHVDALCRQLMPSQLKLCVGHGAAFRHAAYKMDVLALDQLPLLSMHHAQPIVFRCSWAAPEPGGPRSSGTDKATSPTSFRTLTSQPQAVSRWEHVCGEWKVRGAAEAAD
jgi:2,3-bisphosphoglycerate-dependent phosphoglycerate mutase